MSTSLITSAIITSLLIIACNNSAKTGQPAKEDNTAIPSADTIPATKTGGDKDEHGCITSAGYRWSIVKDTCIRIFEAGIKMEPKVASLDQTLAAFVVLSNDKVRAEIFLPTQKKQVVIRRTEGTGDPSTWENGPLKLSLLNGVYTLYDDGEILYQGSSAK